MYVLNSLILFYHHLAISIQVQKVLQTLEDNEEQPLTHCKMEPNMSSSPKLETIEIVVSFISICVELLAISLLICIVAFRDSGRYKTNYSKNAQE